MSLYTIDAIHYVLTAHVYNQTWESSPQSAWNMRKKTACLFIFPDKVPICHDSTQSPHHDNQMFRSIPGRSHPNHHNNVAKDHDWEAMSWSESDNLLRTSLLVLALFKAHHISPLKTGSYGRTFQSNCKQSLQTCSETQYIKNAQLCVHTLKWILHINKLKLNEPYQNLSWA